MIRTTIKYAVLYKISDFDRVHLDEATPPWGHKTIVQLPPDKDYPSIQRRESRVDPVADPQLHKVNARFELVVHLR